eukprot:357880-Prorocentrum_minimum.AAC.1
MARPRDLDGKLYASYAARFEGRIVQKMIRNDGGQGNFQVRRPPSILCGTANQRWRPGQLSGETRPLPARAKPGASCSESTTVDSVWHSESTIVDSCSSETVALCHGHPPIDERH